MSGAFQSSSSESYDATSYPQKSGVVVFWGGEEGFNLEVSNPNPHNNQTKQRKGHGGALASSLAPGGYQSIRPLEPPSPSPPPHPPPHPPAKPYPVSGSTSRRSSAASAAATAATNAAAAANAATAAATLANEKAAAEAAVALKAARPTVSTHHAFHPHAGTQALMRRGIVDLLKQIVATLSKPLRRGEPRRPSTLLECCRHLKSSPATTEPDGCKKKGGGPTPPSGSGV
jgi:hypothetical protein